MKPKRVLYSVAGLSEWVDVAKKLEENRKWTPVYWVTVPGNEEQVKMEFPNIIHEWFYDINKGKYHNNFPDIKLPIDKKTIEEFSNYEHIALDMLKRYDPYNIFSYEERKRLYYNQLKYWLYVLKYMNIEIIIFSESPHSISQYVCYAVGKYYNIEIIMLASTSIPGLLFAKGSIEDTPFVRIHNDESKLDEKNNLIIKNYINRLGKGYEYAEPWYMKEQKKMIGIIPEIRRLFVRLSESFNFSNKIARNYYFKLPNKTIENSYMNILQLIKMKVYSDIISFRLQKKYNIHSCKPDLKEKNFVYMPLQYQPERTSCPEGGVYSNQLLVIDLVSKAMPDDWVLYVKEHPSQFMLSKSHMGRNDYFYEDIIKHENVKLIDINFDSFQLIDNSKAVVTLTGTAGVEALIRGVPALIFGHAWYRLCPGVFEITNYEECQEAFRMIKDDFNLNSDLVNKYLTGLSNFFTLGYINPSNKNSISISTEDHIENIYNAIISFHSTQ